MTLTDHLVRGLKAGAVAGGAYGLFVALIGNPLIRYAETFEHSHSGGGPVVPRAVTALISTAGGVFLGILFGVVVIGALYYFLEPAIPGTDGTKSYLLGAAGFVTVSGAPWLAIPPQPPGVEQALGVETRILWYLLMAIVGAFACGLSGYVYIRLRPRYGQAPAGLGAGLVFLSIPVVATIAPANPVSGSLPAELAFVIQAVTGLGQVGLWFVLASAHAWLLRRDRDEERTGYGRVDHRDPTEPLGVDP